MTESVLNGFFAPASIAVIGASDDTGKPGGKIVENILAKDYAGELFLVNPRADSIQGKPAWASLADLPCTPDLTFIAIPARFVADTLLELARINARRVIVLSSGFGEVDQQGLREEERLRSIADEHGMLLLGPNCLGVMSPVHAGKFAGLLPDMQTGGIDFISGSGATVDILAEQAVRRGLIFHTFVTVGNSAQMGVTEILALYDNEHGPDSSRHIMLYLEKLGSPMTFLHHARNLTARGCILMGIKSGSTEAGRRAAASHTGALAANDTAVQALFDKSGLIRLNSKLEMVDLATALTLSKGRYNGRRACVITDAGGLGVMTTDELNRHGIEVPALKPETRRQLAELLPPGAGVSNPLDLLPTRTPEQVTRVLEILCSDESDQIDYILIMIGAPGLSDNWPVYEALMEAMDRLPLPIFPSFPTSISTPEELARYRACGRCHFEDEVSMARAIGRMVNRPLISAPAPDPENYAGALAASLLSGVTGMASPRITRQVLAAAGIPVPLEQVISQKTEISDLASTIPVPWVMKVVGPVHKSELGGVAAGVTPEAAEETFDRLMAINGATGVLVQETVQGPEVIMGLSREGEFGHLVAFGPGGVLVEVLKDVAFGLAPLTLEESARMVNSVRALPVLKGFRGQPGMDLDILADLLTRVSLLARDVPGIKEMDINPVKGIQGNLAAVDVRIIMD